MLDAAQTQTQVLCKDGVYWELPIDNSQVVHLKFVLSCTLPVFLFWA